MEPGTLGSLRPQCHNATTVVLTGNRLTLIPGSSDFARLLDNPALHAALLDRWLYVHGDSSSRGLFMSIWQQLVPDDDWIGQATFPNSETSHAGIKYVGFIDLIINSSSGVLVHKKDGRKAKNLRDSPARDLSASLTKHWHVLTGCVRITWRMATLARFLPSEPFVELDIDAVAPHARPPDAYILQFGSWDDDRHTVAAMYEAQLKLGLERLHHRLIASHDAIRAMARTGWSHTGPRRPTLVFATSVVPMRQGSGGDVCGSWHASFWASPAWSNLTNHVHLLNRVASSTALQASLGAQCPCLAAAKRLAMRNSMLYHAPHVQNLLDAQRLVQLLLSLKAWRPPPAMRVLQPGHAGKLAALAPKPMAVELGWQSAMSSELAQPFDAGCCCARRANLSAAIDLDGPISMWMNACRLRRPAPRGVGTRAS
jgi:hypothetical protein